MQSLWWCFNTVLWALDAQMALYTKHRPHGTGNQWSPQLKIAKIQIRSGMLEQVQSMKSPTTLRHLGLRRQHLDTAVTLSRGDVPPPQQVRPREILIHYGVLMDCNFSDMFRGCSVRFRSRAFWSQVWGSSWAALWCDSWDNVQVSSGSCSVCKGEGLESSGSQTNTIMKVFPAQY